MLVLGWHGGWEPDVHGVGPRSIGGEISGHDASAAIVRDGVVLAAVEEERLTRVKHSRAFPTQAIRFCLSEAGVGLRDLDAIVIDSSQAFMDEWVGRRRAERPRDSSVDARDHLDRLFKVAFGVDTRHQHRFCGHHTAHTLAAWRCSQFPTALSICVDGVGDGPAGLVCDIEDGVIHPLRHIPSRQSLGQFYVRSIAHLGYKLFDEYKVMGLAPYGDPSVYRSVFDRTYDLRSEGRFEIVDEADRQRLIADIASKIAPDPNGGFGQAQMDFAAALQEALERIALHIAEHFSRVTGRRRLCLSGGVAQNCSMNGQLVRSGLFEHIYIHPAAHDAGNAIGAALSLDTVGAARTASAMPHPFLGPNLGNDEQIEAVLKAWAPALVYERIVNAPIVAAQMIADDKVIAWVQGRSEYGPRALGNRSILADPRPAENKTRINAMIKKREAYRPFAPSVIEERLFDYFESPPQAADYATMSVVLQVRPDMRELLGAVTHVDGTARVQTVGASTNPAYHALITAFGQLSGVSLVLNTSLNNDAEPIVDSVQDAIVCLLTTGLDAMIVGNWRVQKSPAANSTDYLGNLVPVLRRTERLVYCQEFTGCATYFVEADGSAPYPHEPFVVQETVYRILVGGSLGQTLIERCRALLIDLNEVAPQLAALWHRRLIAFNPRTH